MRRYKVVQGPCTFMYLLVPPYSGVQDFWAFPCPALSCLVPCCSVLYPLADFKEIFVSESTVHADIYQPMLVLSVVYTSMYQHMPSGLSGTLLSCLIPCCIHLLISKKSLCLKAQYMLVYTNLCWYIPACTSTCHKDFRVLCCPASYRVVSTCGFQRNPCV